MQAGGAVSITIAIVEDDVIIAGYIRDMICDASAICQVDILLNSALAREYLTVNTPLALILDLHLSDDASSSGGIEVLSSLCQDKKSVAVVVFTGTGDIRTIVKCYEMCSEFNIRMKFLQKGTSDLLSLCEALDEVSPKWRRQ